MPAKPRKFDPETPREQLPKTAPTNGYGTSHGVRTSAVDRARFLEALADTGNMSEACRISGIGRETAWRLRRNDPVFRSQCGEAKIRAAEKLELEARRRAHDGVDEPVFYQGMQCGLIRRYSDTLLMFLLKGAKPNVYRDRIEHSGDKKKPVVIDAQNLTDEQLTAIIAAELRKQQKGEE